MLNVIKQTTAILLSLLLPAVIPLPADACGAISQKLGTCPGIGAAVGNGGVELSAGGSSGGGQTGGGGQRPDTGGVPVKTGPPTLDEFMASLVRREEFTSTAPGDIPAITLADIATFRPAVGTDRMEPNGWMVVGLDANFYSDATRHEVAGALLGFPATVRFTPKVWHWTFGDGHGLSSARPGASWAALRVPEFSPTATSHVYAAPGSYTIDLAIEFAAEYRVAGPDWVPIAGTVTVPANRIVATAGDAKTVLVGRDCAANPSGAGC